MKKVCSKCGEINPGNSAHCNSCYTSLKDATIKEDVTSRENIIIKRIKKCSNCGKENKLNAYNCVHCGNILAKGSSEINTNTHTNYKSSQSNNSGCFVYIISLLIPLVGFIVGAIWLASDDYDKNTQGKTCIILGLVSVVLSGIMFAIMSGG